MVNDPLQLISCKDLAALWNIPVTKVTQARDPWMLKTGALADEAPREFCLMVLVAIERYRELKAQRDLERRKREEQAFRREVLTETTGHASTDSRRTTLPPRPISTRESNL